MPEKQPTIPEALLHPQQAPDGRWLNNAAASPMSLLRQQEFPEGRSKRLTIIEKNEAKNFALRVCRDPDYQESVMTRARAGTLGSMEQVIWAYAYGKPVERVEVRTPDVPAELSGMTNAELADRAEVLASFLRELAASDAKPVAQTPSSEEPAA
jgi:hypothetical protein